MIRHSNDDGSSFYLIDKNFGIYGGAKMGNFDGHNKVLGAAVVLLFVVVWLLLLLLWLLFVVVLNSLLLLLLFLFVCLFPSIL